MPHRSTVRSLCRQCLTSQRHFSASATHSRRQLDLPPSPPPAGYARLTDRALVSLSGADSASFLQGLITQNIVAPEGHASPRSAYYAAFLNAPGRVLHDVFIYPTPDAGHLEPSYLIEVDKSEAKNFLRHLKKYKLRAKVSLRVLDEGERSVWASWDERRSLAQEERDEGKELPISCEDKRAPGLGYRTVADGDFEERGRFLPGAEVSQTMYTLRRMFHGVPEGQIEIPNGSALPMDSNMDVMGGIDFHKGCYLGQELTIRTHHRGVVRKRVLPVQLYDFDDPPPESDVLAYSDDTELPLPPAGASMAKVGPRKSPSPGKFLSGVGNIGLALCRLETMTDIAFTGEATRYNPDEEFSVSWDADPEGANEAGRVKVKAFIPPWTREYILRAGARQRTPMGEAQRAKEAVNEMQGKIDQLEEAEK